MNKIILNSFLFSLLAISSSACNFTSLAGDQGSVSNPVAIGSYPISNYPGSVGVYSANTGFSYYRVDGITPGGIYTVKLTNVSGLVSMQVDDSSFGYSYCYVPTNTSGADLTCNADTTYMSYFNETSFYIEVENDDNKKVTYDISVQ